MKKQKETNKLTFFQAYRKRGFGLTLTILNETKENGIKECEFFIKLKENNSYPNEFYRVKKYLINAGLIMYKLDDHYNKLLSITQKGIKILEKIEEIDKLFAEKIN